MHQFEGCVQVQGYHTEPVIDIVDGILGQLPCFHFHNQFEFDSSQPVVHMRVQQVQDLNMKKQNRFEARTRSRSSKDHMNSIQNVDLMKLKDVLAIQHRAFPVQAMSMQIPHT